MHPHQALYNVAALAVLAFPLSGCGGGGGSKSDPAPAVITTTPPPANITQTLQLNGGSSTGLSVSVPYVYDYPTDTIVLGTSTAASPTTLNVTPSGTITSVTLNAPNASRLGNSANWTAPGDDVLVGTNGIDVCEGSCTTTPRELHLSTSNVAGASYQYLSYGSWSDQSGTTGTVTGVAGFTVVGQPTLPANIPTTGSATYSGSLNGFFTDPSVPNLSTAEINANLSAVADFSARTFIVSTTNTQLFDGGTIISANEHNITGTLSYPAGSNQLSGTFSTVTSGLTGPANAHFFGPTAGEAGGVFDIAGGGKRAVGTFVGKQ